METKNSKKEPQRGYVELELEICGDAFEFLESVLQMGFRRRSNRWATVLHLDGTRDKDGKPTTVVYENTPNLAYDYGRQRGERIPFLMVQRGLATDYHDAIRILCQATGRDVPQLSDEIKQRIQQEQQRREAIALMSKQFDANGATDAAKMALDYLLKRGWSGTEASAAGLGVATDEALMLLYPDGKGVSYRGWLSMPIYQADRLAGVKFRNTNKKEYINTDFEKSEKLAFIPGHVASGVVVVVEGELDALHAKVKTDAALQHHWQTMSTDDIYPVVATEGGPISDRQLSDAISRGVKQFILALDNDDKGPGYTDISAKKIRKAGCQAYVLQYPDGVKDLDEWFGHKKDGKLYFGFDELREAESQAVSWYKWKAVRAYKQAEADDTDMARGAFIDEARNMLQDDTITAYDKHNLYQALKELDDIPGLDTLLKEDAEITKNKARGETLRKLGDATIKGSEFLIRKYKKQLQALDDERFEETEVTDDSIWQEMLEHEANKGIDTGWTLGETKLVLPSGGLTVFCLPSNHGKTAILNNVCLSALAQTDKEVWYYHYEEDNGAYMGNLIKILSQEERQITTGLLSSDDDKSKKARQAFKHIKAFRRSGKLNLQAATPTVEQLCEKAKSAADEGRLGCLIIDYIQLMTCRNKMNTQKETMTEVCRNLMKLAATTHIPVITAAQFNRNPKGPLDMSVHDIADASDIYYQSSCAVFGWNTSKPVEKYARGFTDNGTADPSNAKIGILQSNGALFNTDDSSAKTTIYLELAKSRTAKTHCYGIVEFNMNTGKIIQTCRK